MLVPKMGQAVKTLKVIQKNPNSKSWKVKNKPLQLLTVGQQMGSLNNKIESIFQAHSPKLENVQELMF